MLQLQFQKNVSPKKKIFTNPVSITYLYLLVYGNKFVLCTSSPYRIILNKNEQIVIKTHLGNFILTVNIETSAPKIRLNYQL